MLRARTKRESYGLLDSTHTIETDSLVFVAGTRLTSTRASTLAPHTRDAVAEARTLNPLSSMHMRW